MSSFAQPEIVLSTRRQIVAEVFHTLAQPLTELRGTLDLALVRPIDVREMRNALAHSAAAVDRITDSLCFLRDLADAEEPGAVQSLDFLRAVRDVFEDFRPVAEERNIAFEFLGDTKIEIHADPGRVSQAVTLLLDSVLAASPRSVLLRNDAHGCQISANEARLESLPAGQLRSIDLARTLLKTAGCGLEIRDYTVVITAGVPEHSLIPENTDKSR